MLALGLPFAACDVEVHAPTADPAPETQTVCLFGQEAPEEQPLLTGAAGATFVGDYVYLPGLVGKRNKTAILKLDGEGGARLVRWADELAPFPHTQPWQAVSATTYARVHDTVLDVLDATDPEHPAVSHVHLGRFAATGASHVLGHDGARVFVCVGEGEYSDNQMLSIDLSDPAEPGAPQTLETSACAHWGYSSTGAGLWADWYMLDPSELFRSLSLYTLGSSGPELTMEVVLGEDAPDLIGIERAFIGDGVVYVPTNEGSHALVLYPQLSGGRVAVTESFGFIAFVEGQEAFLFDGSSLTSVDLSDPDRIGWTGRTLVIGTREAPSVALLAGHDATRALFADVEGQLYVAPLDGDGEIEPLRISGVPAQASTPGCF